MLLSIGLKNIIFILGVILLMRFIGKMMSARRNMDSQQRHQQTKNDLNFEKEKAKRNFGKTTVEKLNTNSKDNSDYTDFEEVD